MRKVALLAAVGAVFLTMFCDGPAFAGDVESAEVVRDKIQALGLRDDSVPYDEQPRRWLSKRRGEVLPLLIEGLDDKEARVASECLKLLDKAPESEELLNALVRIAAGRDHPISSQATLSLCRFAEHPGARELLE